MPTVARYNNNSPYFLTKDTQFFLDNMVNRPIPKVSDDKVFIINQTYEYRPDLLAHDLYNQGSLWWVFYQRNPNALTSPPWDFKVGTRLYLPKMQTLSTALGI
jgi:hypothetical protein